MHNALKNERSEKVRGIKEKRYLGFLIVIFAFLAALRFVAPGTDTENYMEWYQAMPMMTFEEVIAQRSLSYTYYLSSKMFAFTGLPYQYWFGFLEILFLSGFIRLIKKFATDKIMAMFLFFTCGLFTLSIGPLKQVFAMALIWHGFVDLQEKKYIRAGILALLAYFAHKTSMIFLIAFVLPYVSKLRNIYYTLIVTLIVILLFSYSTVLSSLTDFMGDEHYVEYLMGGSDYSAVTFIFYLTLLGIGYLCKKAEKQASTLQRTSIGLAAIAVFSQVFSFRVASAFRLGVYFVPFLLFYLLNNIAQRRGLQYLVFFITSVWLLYTGRTSPYRFFWE